MGDIAIRDDTAEVVQQFDLARADGLKALKQAEAVVGYMAEKCKGPKFISQIQGRNYPLVTWWTTVGAALGLFPQELSSTKIEAPELTYLAVVEVRHGDQVVSRASAICSAKESTWRNRDEYAVKSMATTRATGKAYRIAFAFLAVMAGLEPTPAEEMPVDVTPPKAEAPKAHRPADQQEVINEIKDLVTDANAAAVRERCRKATTLEQLVAIKGELLKERDGAVLDANTKDDALNAAAEAGFEGKPA